MTTPLGRPPQPTAPLLRLRLMRFPRNPRVPGVLSLLHAAELGPLCLWRPRARRTSFRTRSAVSKIRQLRNLAPLGLNTCCTIARCPRDLGERKQTCAEIFHKEGAHAGSAGNLITPMTGQPVFLHWHWSPMTEIPPRRSGRKPRG